MNANPDTPTDTTSLNRPRFHCMPLANWMNDPNGLIQWRGQYHLFYQHNPDGPYHGNIHWGHAVSSDLAHWTHLPVALAPTPNGPDQYGCWSGVVINDGGRPVAVYTGVWPPCACLAFGSDDLVQWEKYPGNPVITPPPELDVIGFRDHSVWREAGVWYQVIGAGTQALGGTALLYRSTDLLHWEYQHPLCSGRDLPAPGPWQADMWECPDFFRLGEKHVLFVSGLNQGTGKNTGVFYITGDLQDTHFLPELAAPLDGGDIFYAPQSFLDDKGRRIQFGWLKEDCSDAEQRAMGWSGAMSLPLQLGLSPAGKITLRPVPELQSLRGPAYGFRKLSVEAANALSGVQGVNLEIEIELGSDFPALTLALRCTPDGAERTLVRVDPALNSLTIDRTLSSLNPNTGRSNIKRSLDLDPGEALHLHIFLDGSLLEIFVNDRAYLAARIYPTRTDSTGLTLTLDAPEACIPQLKIWSLV